MEASFAFTLQLKYIQYLQAGYKNFGIIANILVLYTINYGYSLNGPGSGLKWIKVDGSELHYS